MSGSGYGNYQAAANTGSPGGYVPSIVNIGAMYGVNLKTWESIKQSLYDSAVYPAAGTAQLNFFAQPVGQGTPVLGSGATKTLSDTNMQLSGQLPTNQAFLVQEIEVLFEPTTPTVAAQMPAVFGAQAAAQIVNDAYIFYRAGNLNFNIGSKSYLQEAPLLKFPPKTNFGLNAALSDATTAGAAFQSRIAFGTALGTPYIIKPNNLLLIANQNFNVSLNWPEGVQAVTEPAVVRLSLNGLLYRAAQ